MAKSIDESEAPILDNSTVSPSTPQAGAWRASIWKFLLFSAVGLALFVVPFQWDGKVTILLGLLTDVLQGFLGNAVSYIVVGIVTISALGALAVKALKPNLSDNSLTKTLFDVEWLWLSARVIGMVFVWMIFLQVGPEFIIDRNTGGVIFEDLTPILVPLFFDAARYNFSQIAL